MINQQRRPRRAVLGAIAVIGTAAAGVLFAVPANAVSAPTITFTQGVLSVVGDAGNNTLVVGSTPAGTITLNGTEVLGGAPTRFNVTRVHLDGGAGDDTLKLDETNGQMPPGELIGGEGRNSITGGSGDDTIVGGGGIDRVDGGPGVDTVDLGGGSDQFTWNPGDGDDRVDGGGGSDTLIFNAGPEELLQLFGDGPRTVFFLQPDPFSPPGTAPRLDMPVSGFESMKVNIADLSHREVRVNDMPDAVYAVIRVNFAPHTGPGMGSDDVLYRGTVGADGIRLAGTPSSGLTVFGGAQAILVNHADRLDVFGGDGDDVIDATGLAAGTVHLIEFGGGNPFVPGHITDGNDTLIGTPGDDDLVGGTGINHYNGRGGNDNIDDQ